MMSKTCHLKILSICFLGWPLVLYSAESYKVPRTDWGQPDLQGVWNFSSAVPMQRPLEFGRRQFLTDAEASNGIRHFELGAGADVVPPNRFGIETGLGLSHTITILGSIILVMGEDLGHLI